jgi:hypothetical protein
MIIIEFDIDMGIREEQCDIVLRLKNQVKSDKGWFLYGRDEKIAAKVRYYHQTSIIHPIARLTPLCCYSVDTMNEWMVVVGSHAPWSMDDGYLKMPCARMYDENHKYYVDIYWYDYHPSAIID